MPKKKHARNFIRELRKERGMTIQDLADKLGVTNPHVSMMETGVRGLSWKMIQRISKILECHPMEITQGPQLDAPQVMNRKEEEVLRTYRAMKDGERRVFLNMLKTFPGAKKAERLKKKKK